MKCLIVDDDPLICDLLEHFCSKVEQINSVTCAATGFETINLLNNTRFDLLFLDFDLPDINGRDILNVLSEETPVIMVTSNKDFGSESYNYDQIIDFLVKPVNFARFYKSILKAETHKKQKTPDQNGIFVKDGKKLVKIDLDEVKYLKSEGNYMSIVFSDKKILTLMTFKELASKLPPFFQKVHRSYMVNLNKIDSISNNALEIDKDHIPVSKSFEKELLKKIDLLN